MSRPRPFLALAATATVLAVLLAPAAEAVPFTLFAHVTDASQDFVLNTQEPDAAFAIDSGKGVLTPTLTCVPSLPAAGLTEQEHHTMYGYLSPSTVEYADGEVRAFPERGLAVDAVLDTAQPMVLHWYLSEPQPGDPGQASPAPNVVVRATMRAGDSISVDDEAYNSGPVLAHGQSPPATLAGQASQGVEVDRVGGRVVYHVVVPMTIDDPVVPRATGFNLRVDTFVESPACPDGGLMPNSVLLHSSDGHRPRLDLGVVDPLKLDYIHPQVVGDDLVVHTSIRDPWGAYDVLAVSATIEGPGLEPTALERVPVADPSYEHPHRPPAVDPSWILRGYADLPAGNYTVRLTAQTLQGHSQSWSFGFDLGQEQAMPAVPMAWLVFALAAAVKASRRR